MEQENSAARKAAGQSFDPQPLLDLIAGIQADLDRLKGLVEQAAPKFDPANPANKMAGGKLSEEGVECCYRMSTRARAAIRWRAP